MSQHPLRFVIGNQGSGLLIIPFQARFDCLGLIIVSLHQHIPATVTLAIDLRGSKIKMEYTLAILATATPTQTRHDILSSHPKINDAIKRKAPVAQHAT